jgi:DNA-binding XRE family transcriptional regulator
MTIDLPQLTMNHEDEAHESRYLSYHRSCRSTEAVVPTEEKQLPPGVGVDEFIRPRVINAMTPISTIVNSRTAMRIAKAVDAYPAPRLFGAGGSSGLFFRQDVCVCVGHGTQSPMPRKKIDGADKHVGSRVRMRRMTVGMTLDVLGKAVGVTYQQLQKYENGVNRIGPGRLQHIAQVLQVTSPFFFEGLPDRSGLQSIS